MPAVRDPLACRLQILVGRRCACGGRRLQFGLASVAVSEGVTGRQPTLPPPESSLIPTVNVVDGRRMDGGQTPPPAAGLGVTAFARGLDHPRWLHVLPNGDVLVAETNAPPRPEDDKRHPRLALQAFQKKAGGAVPSANRITLLRDADGDGVAEAQSVFLPA